MKLLFDQNISFKIINKISAYFPEAKQVVELNLYNSTDLEIWNYAKINSFTIVTFDKDFLDIQKFRGVPPKLILLKTGNSTTESLANLLYKNYNLIRDFYLDDNLEYLEVFE